MPTYTIEKLLDLPALLIKMNEDFNSRDTIAAYLKDVRRYYDEAAQPLYMIVDTRDLNLEFGLMLDFVQEGVRNQDAIARHPKNAGIVVVTESKVQQAVMKGLNTASFGFVKNRVFSTVEEAKDWVREQLK